MNLHKLFDDKSDLYASARPRYPPALYDYLVSLCDDRTVAWDCACGNGQVAVDLINYFEQVYATDVSLQQIAHVLKKPRIQYQVMSAESPLFSDNLFDLVCVGQALHWFDYDKFWPQVKRVLKPGGIFAAWGYSFFTIKSQMDNQIREALSTSFFETIKPYWTERHRLLWDYYRDVPFPLERIASPPISMMMTWDLDELFAYLHSWSSTRRCMADLGHTFFEEAYRIVEPMWGNSRFKKKIEMDFCLVVGKCYE